MKEKKNSTERMVVGCLFILLMAVCWAMEAELTQNLQIEGSKAYYPKPLFIGYLTRCSYSIWLVPWLIWRFHGIYTQKWSFSQRMRHFQKEKTLAVGAVGIMFLMFSNGYTWYLSLSKTPVSVNTAIYNCVSVEVFLLSIPFLNEGVSSLKVVAVLVSLAGILCIFFSPTDENDKIQATSVGYLFLILSVTLYAFEEVLYKKLTNYVEKKDQEILKENLFKVNENSGEKEEEKEEEEGEGTFDSVMYSGFFLGVAGVANTLIIFWVIVLFDATGIETFEWPDPLETRYLAINCFFDTLLFISVFAATALTTPLLVSLGSLLVIPCSVFLDYFLHSYLPGVLVWVGIVLIVLGFLSLLFAGGKAKQFEKERKLEDWNIFYVLFHEKFLFPKKDAEKNGLEELESSSLIAGMAM